MTDEILPGFNDATPVWDEILALLLKGKSPQEIYAAIKDRLDANPAVADYFVMEVDKRAWKTPGPTFKNIEYNLDRLYALVHPNHKVDEELKPPTPKPTGRKVDPIKFKVMYPTTSTRVVQHYHAILNMMAVDLQGLKRKIGDPLCRVATSAHFKKGLSESKGSRVTCPECIKKLDALGLSVVEEAEQQQ